MHFKLQMCKRIAMCKVPPPQTYILVGFETIFIWSLGRLDDLGPML
jgi:hypothetical protein